MVVLHCAWGKLVMLSELDCWASVLGVASPTPFISEERWFATTVRR
jgi:hypothetical protein